MHPLEEYNRSLGYDGYGRLPNMDAYYILFKLLPRLHLSGFCLDLEFDRFDTAAPDSDFVYGMDEFVAASRLQDLLDDGFRAQGERLRTFVMVIDNDEFCWYQRSAKAFCLIGYDLRFRAGRSPGPMAGGSA